jgi:hypothetical protein
MLQRSMLHSAKVTGVLDVYELSTGGAGRSGIEHGL